MTYCETKFTSPSAQVADLASKHEMFADGLMNFTCIHAIVFHTACEGE
jgi:hypothetical protein